MGIISTGVILERSSTQEGMGPPEANSHQRSSRALWPPATTHLNRSYLRLEGEQARLKKAADRKRTSATDHSIFPAALKCGALRSRHMASNLVNRGLPKPAIMEGQSSYQSARHVEWRCELTFVDFCVTIYEARPGSYRNLWGSQPLTYKVGIAHEADGTTVAPGSQPGANLFSPECPTRGLLQGGKPA